MDINKHKFSKSIYKMDLHEELVAEALPNDILPGYDSLPLRVLRVPGGWIYYNTHITSDGVFVPLKSDPMDRSFQ